jgi:biopolymer transport protein ExbD
MKFERRSRKVHELGAGALTDIMFFLMLFFLIASTMATPSIIKLFLPSSSSKQAISNPTTTVSINKDFQYFIDDVPVKDDELIPRLAHSLQDKKEPVVMLRADKSVPVEYVVNVFEIGNSVKDAKVFIATQKHR